METKFRDIGQLERAPFLSETLRPPNQIGPNVNKQLHLPNVLDGVGTRTGCFLDPFFERNLSMLVSKLLGPMQECHSDVKEGGSLYHLQRALVVEANWDTRTWDKLLVPHSMYRCHYINGTTGSQEVKGKCEAYCNDSSHIGPTTAPTNI